MKKSNNRELVLELHREIRKLLDQKSNGTISQKKMPYTVAACEHHAYHAIGYYHGKSDQTDFKEIILKKLLELGPLNKKPITKGYESSVGHCAENYAATKLLDDLEHDGFVNCLQLSDIEFSPTFIVKNRSEIPFCNNCQTVYGK